MPCNCDHLEPSTAERMRKKAAELLVYLHDIGRVTLMDIKEYRKVAAHVYGQGLGDAPVKKAVCSA